MEELLQELRDLGGDAIGVQADVTKEEDVKRMVQETVKTFGTWIYLSIMRELKMRFRHTNFHWKTGIKSFPPTLQDSFSAAVKPLITF